jgi:hypothetical protein
MTYPDRLQAAYGDRLLRVERAVLRGLATTLRSDSLLPCLPPLAIHPLNDSETPSCKR